MISTVRWSCIGRALRGLDSDHFSQTPNESSYNFSFVLEAHDERVGDYSLIDELAEAPYSFSNSRSVPSRCVMRYLSEDSLDRASQIVTTRSHTSPPSAMNMGTVSTTDLRVLMVRHRARRSAPPNLAHQEGRADIPKQRIISHEDGDNI